MASSKPAWHWDEALSSLQKRQIGSPADACLELEMLWIGLQAILQNLPFRPNAEQLRNANSARLSFYQRFKNWVTRFHHLSSAQNSSTTDNGRIAILQVRQILVGVLLRVDMANLETSWDDFHEEFTRATLLIEQLLDQNTQDSGLPAFTPMLLKALHFMARVCRNPVLRRKMITILGVQHRKALSTVHKTAKHPSYTQIIDAIVTVEESAWTEKELCHCLPECVPGEFICNNHRVAEVDFKFRPNSLDELTLRTVGDVSNNLPGQMLFIKARMWS